MSIRRRRKNYEIHQNNTEGQMEIFPHISISLGYVDEFGNDCDDAVLIFIGCSSLTYVSKFQETQKPLLTKEEFIKDMNQI